MTAREAAHSALRVFRIGGDYRAELLRLEPRLSDSRDYKLAMRITLGVVRNLTLCDYYIASVSSIKLSKLEPQALDILRAAVYQLAFLDKVPKSAVVDEAVKQARKKLNPRAAGFVNAVLRKLASRLSELPADDAPSKAERFALRYSHPEWLVREFIARIGEDETEALLKINNTEPPVYARVNTLKTSQDRLLAELSALGVEAVPSALPDTLELHSMPSLNTFETFKKGEFFIQDPSSTHAALATGAFSGARVIDACAAPGGKSFAMAIMMQNTGELLAFDAEKKVPLIKSGAERLGLSCIKARAGDSSVRDEGLVGSADIVLVDAPCSGLGVIRKKPEIRFKAQEDIAHLPTQALKILTNCADYVKTGGTLVYSTCTLLRCENEEVVESFLRSERGSAFRLKSQETLWPHRCGFDGFFVAVMQR